MSIELNVSGMSCGHCEKAVSDALKAVAGVRDVQVSLRDGKARVEGEGLDAAALVAAVVEEGYNAQIAGA